jgi:hypothetical protein
MATQIAVNARKAALMMFEAGLGLNVVQTGIYDIPQPSKGYYYITDICDFINNNSMGV